MASVNINKSPPIFKRGDNYEKWKSRLQLWLSFTTLEKRKQGPAIAFTLSEDAVLQLGIGSINNENGVENIIEVLDRLYLRDRTQLAFEALEDFESYKRPKELSITDYCNEFDRRYNKARSYGTEMSEDVLGFRLLKSANLAHQQEQLARATINVLTYNNMKTQLKKIHDSDNISNQIKIEENINFEESEVLYGRNYPSSRRGQNFYKRPTGRRYQRPYCGGAGFGPRGGRGRNPPDKFGNPSRCIECGSINHWVNKCPDREYSEPKDTYYHITLFQSDAYQAKSLVAESMNCGILDCGASETVCGQIWFDCYYDSLNEEDKKKILYKRSNNVFKFGDGKTVHSLQRVCIPAKIGVTRVMINTDIVDSDIPLLLSKQSMKKAGMKLNFNDDTAQILGQKIILRATQSGHYALPLSESQYILEEAQKNPFIKVRFSYHKTMNAEQKALKLHRQFAHPPPEKLLKLIRYAGSDDLELQAEIMKISQNCQICKIYRKCPPRPIVGLPMATTFGECVAMDLKQFGNIHLLHLIDHATRLSACAIVKSKRPAEIIEKIFCVWISIYGCPEKFLSDNGGEFSNEAFRELCEKVNITVKTTGAEAPWSNGLCERHNQVLGEMLTKTMADTDCSLDIAIAWCINAKNSLHNVHGYSPFQLVFGKNPRIPGILVDKPPAFDDDTSFKIIRDNLNALHSARQAFVSSESSEKIRRALRHNVRSSGDTKFHTGDKVYYKRLAHKTWSGPAVVLGQDGQQVLVKHGGVYVRVHPCRLILEKPTQPDSAKIDKISQTSRAIDPQCNNIHDKDMNEEESDDESVEEITNNENLEDRNGTSVSNPKPVTVSRGRGRPLKHKSNPTDTSNKNIALKKNMQVQYKLHGEDNWVRTKLISKSGKCSGKYANEWNTENEAKEKEVIDFDRDVEEWDEINEDVNLNSELSKSDDTTETLITEIFLTESLQDTLQAKHKELASWKKNDVYDEVEDNGQYCISVRWVVTPKIINGKLETKARLCARGFEETCAFRTDSPTCMRESVRIALCLIASSSWILHSIDYKTAFLQGKAIDRNVYLRPPSECKTSKVWKLKKTVYGLADAPRVWFLRLKEEMIKLGTKMSTYDQGVFFWHSTNGLEGILVCFVDDQLWGGTKKFEECVIEKLRGTFDISCEHSSAFKYIGIELKQRSDFSIYINQESYIRSIEPISMDRHRQLQKDDAVTMEEKARLRCLIGQLNWIAGMTRPDVGFAICQLSSKITNVKVSHLNKANKILRYVKNTPTGICFARLDNLKNLKIVTYSDASYANLPDGGSQGGQIVFLADEEMRACPLTWKSTKIKRVVKSTLAAETLSFVESCDMSFLMAKIVAEIIYNDRESILPIHCQVDNKSLFEAAKTIKVIKDIRLRVEMSIVREMIERKEVTLSWIPSNEQLADTLTKDGSSSATLLKVLDEAHLFI